MEESKEVKVLKEEAKEDDRKVIVFRKPFTFENVSYSEIDMSGLEDLTGMDLVEVGKQYGRSNNVALYQEYEADFAFALAARATEKPIEFFFALPIKESNRIKEYVTHFFLSKD